MVSIAKKIRIYCQEKLRPTQSCSFLFPPEKNRFSFRSSGLLIEPSVVAAAALVTFDVVFAVSVATAVVVAEGVFVDGGVVVGFVA